MTVEKTEVISGTFFPNGATTVFPFDFKVSSEEELQVITPDETEVSASLYSVSLNSGEGGSVTFAVAPLATDYPNGIRIVSNPNFQQKAQISNTGRSFDPKILEAALDKITTQILFLRDLATRAPVVARGGQSFSLGSFADAEDGDLVEWLDNQLVPSSVQKSVIAGLVSDAENAANLAILGADITFAANFNAGERSVSDGDLFYVPENGQWFVYKKGENNNRDDVHLLLGNAAAAPVAPSLFTGLGWDGTAGNGFDVTPVDPPRTTAKPACRLVTPDHQYFTDELEVGVVAYANNSGSLLDNCGLRHVIFRFEGNSITVSAPSFRTFTRFDGSTYKVLGWWARLRKPSGIQGEAHLYVEAVPADTSMQSRVIGPHSFSPHDVFPATGTIHDYEIEVDPDVAEVAGATYQTLHAAYGYLQTEQSENPRITIKKASPTGFYDIIRGANVGEHGGKGYCTVEADELVVLGKENFTDLEGTIARPYYTSLRFKGSNIVIEFENMDALWGDNVNVNRNFWFEGVRMINSGGRENYWQKGPRSLGFSRNNSPWVTDCQISGLPTIFNSASLVRGCIASEGFFDCANHAECMVANIIDDWDSQFWTNDRDAFTVEYTGAGGATIEMTGGNDANSRTITLKSAPPTLSDTFTVEKGDAAVAADTNWKVSDVVDFINGVSDWSATLIDDSLRAVMLGSPGRDGAFDITDTSSGPVTFVTQNGKHADFWQLLEGATNIANIVIVDNLITNFAGQKLFLSAGSTTLHDAIFINNAFGDLYPGGQYETEESLFSQLARSAHSHVVIAHSSFEQGILLRPNNGYNPDAYCLISNIVAASLTWDGTPDADLGMTDNHLFAGSTAPSGATGTTIGGDETTNFVDPATGDFTPAGSLYSVSKTPIAERDIVSDRRAASAPPGAVA